MWFTIADIPPTCQTQTPNGSASGRLADSVPAKFAPRHRLSAAALSLYLAVCGWRRILQNLSSQTRSGQRWLLLILALQIVLCLTTIVVTPLWQGHEADYYNVVRFLTTNGRLPTEADYPPGEADVRQATQPPVYFWVSAPVVALLDDTQPVPPGMQPNLVCVGGESANTLQILYPLTPAYRFPVSGAVLAGYGLRLLNLVFGLIAVYFTWRVGRALFPARPQIAVLGAALLAFEPNSVQLMTTISNDAPLFALAAVNLYCAVRLFQRGQVRWGWVIPLILTAALAILTRLSGWACLAFTVLVVAYAIGLTLWRARRHASRQQLRLALVALLLVVGAVAALAVFNLSQYGTIFGRYRWLDDLIVSALRDFGLPWVIIIGTFGQTALEYVAPLMALTTRNALLVVYTLLAAVPLAAALGGIVVMGYQWRRGQNRSLSPYALLLAAVGTAVALVVFRNVITASAMGGATLYNTAAIFAPLRYYNTGLPPLALLMSAGLVLLADVVSHWLRPRLSAAVATALSILPAVALAAVWFCVVLLNMDVLAQERSAATTLTLQQLQTRSDVTRVALLPSSGAPTLSAPQVLAYQAAPAERTGVYDLTLYATISTPTDVNYAAVVEMTQGETLLNRCEFVPARGYAPTTFWPPGEVVRFDTEIPNCAGVLDAPVDVSLRWLAADLNGSLIGESPPVSLGTLDPPVEQAASCPTTLGIIAGGYRVVRFNSPPSVHVDEPYLPSVNWIVTAPSPDVVSRTFVFTHATTQEQYTCSAGDRAASLWLRGEYLYFERCPMTFPPDATPGDYAVSVMLANAAGEALPATDVAGHPLSGNLVPLGTVRLER